MFKTFPAYRSIIGNVKLYYLLVILFILLNIATSVFVHKINIEIQEAFLTILSIIFPLIAGFLTFGKDTLKSIKKQIQTINEKDRNDIGIPVTDSDKRKIRFLKDLSLRFVEVVIGTFIISFVLIIILLIAKFNDYEFTTNNHYFPLKEYICENLLIIFLKIGFFFLLYLMFLNTLYLVIFIININKHDEIISEER
jgi:hypothetical protein